MIKRHLPTSTYHGVVEAAGLLHFAGVVADDLSLDMKGQASQIFDKIEKLLLELGTGKENLVSAMIYITDFDQKAGMNEAWLDWLHADHLPTRATIGAADLGENVLIEVVVTAAR